MKPEINEYLPLPAFVKYMKSPEVRARRERADRIEYWRTLALAIAFVVSVTALVIYAAIKAL